jgi:hypothetical protein|nr:MAG TPA: holin [Caudoviricetes sp.]
MILHLLEEKSAEGLQNFIMIRVCVVLACWLFMIVSVLIDFWSGVSTAKALGEQLQSKGFRRTIAKTADYIRIMIFAVMFDMLGICFIHAYILPFATIICTIAVMLIEGKSVIENCQRKKAHAAEIPEVVKKIVQAVTAKQATELLEQLTTLTNGQDDKDTN